MKMSDLGEKLFLAELLPRLEQHPRFVNGFGDDAAAVQIDGLGDHVLVTKIDRAAQPMAAKRGWVNYAMWGRLAVTANCSDLLAAGAVPKAFMLALILPGDFDRTAAEDIVMGCAAECAEHDVAFVGGDTKEGNDAQVVGSGFGIAQRSSLHGRKGAKVGDFVVLAGELGGFLGAYFSLSEKIYPATSAEWTDRLHYISHPQAMWREAEFMNNWGGVQSAMDSSDGVYDTLETLANPLGVLLYEDAIPYHKFAHTYASKSACHTLSLGLGVGDWNIVYTVNPQVWNSVASEINTNGLQLAHIGEVTNDRFISVIDSAGRSRRLRRTVNEHFSRRQEDEGDYLDLIRRSPYEGVVSSSHH